MSSRSSATSRRFGKQEPSFEAVPRNIDRSDYLSAIRLINKGGIKSLQWQKHILELWLSRTGDAWAAGSCALFVPRQNGKTFCVVSRACWGMVAYGEWVIYTAHLQKTATETFEEIRAFFETPVMSKYVKEIKTALGREEIKLTNGGRIKFLARTRNGGRGQHGDLLIFDEAQELDDTAQASFIPCLAASKNPQTLYLGTPPDETAPGEVVERLRESAKAGTDGIAWSEWSAAEWDNSTIGSEAVWADCNPSYGYLIRKETIENEYAQMAPDKFARERLGWWSPRKQVDHPIQIQAWNRCRVEIAPRGLLVYGVKFAPDGSTVSLSVCVKPDDGAPFVETVENRSMAQGIGWLVDWLVQRKDKPAQIIVDGKAGAQTLVERLRERGVGGSVLMMPSTRDVIAASASMVNAVKEQAVTHAGQPGLTASATMSIKRRIGNDGGFGFDSTDDADATLIESCALALWAANTTKRKPERKAVIF